MLGTEDELRETIHVSTEGNIHNDSITSKDSHAVRATREETGGKGGRYGKDERGGGRAKGGQGPGPSKDVREERGKEGYLRRRGRGRGV